MLTKKPTPERILKKKSMAHTCKRFVSFTGQRPTQSIFPMHNTQRARGGQQLPYRGPNIQISLVGHTHLSLQEDTRSDSSDWAHKNYRHGSNISSTLVTNWCGQDACNDGYMQRCDHWSRETKSQGVGFPTPGVNRTERSLDPVEIFPPRTRWDGCKAANPFGCSVLVAVQCEIGFAQRHLSKERRAAGVVVLGRGFQPEVDQVKSALKG